MVYWINIIRIVELYARMKPRCTFALFGELTHKLTPNMPLTIWGGFGSFINTISTDLTQHVYGACIPNVINVM